jgi:serine/threonine protein kinase
MELVEDDGEDAEETTRGILTTHARDLKRVQRHASGNLGVEGSLEHDAAMLQQVADRTRKRFVKRIGGLRKVFAAGRITDGGPVSCGPPGGGAPLADDAAQALRELQQQMEQLRPEPALADTAANGGATPRVTETVRKSVLNLEVEESPLSVVSCVSDDEDMSPLVLPPPPPGGPSSSSKAGGGSGGGAFREQLLTSEVSSSSSVADGSAGTVAAEPSAALQEALTAQARKLRSLKTTLQRTAGQRSQLLHRPQPAVTALHYWLEHTALCCSTYDALVDVDRAMDIHLALDAESAALAELQNQFREAFAGLPEPSAGGDSDVPWGAESPAEAVPSLLRRRAPPFIRLPGPDEFCCALRTRLPAGRGGAGMALGGVVAASPRTPRGVLPAMPTTRSAKRPPPSEPAFVELVQGFLRRELGLTRQQGEAGEQGRARPAGLGEGGSLVEVLERGFDLAPVQRQTLSAELSQRTIAVSEDGEESPADLERAVEAVDATWVDRLLGPPLGCKRVGYMLKRNKRGLWQARWFVLRSDANSAGELRYYRRHTNTLAEIGQGGGGGGGGGGAARTINTAPKTPKMTRNVRQPEPEPEPELELMGGGEGEGVAVVECEQPLGTLDLARAVSCYACGALHGERRRRDVRVQTPLRTWRLRARSAREAVAWAADLEEMRAQAAIRLQRQQQQQQRQTPLSRSGSSSSSSISRRVSTGAESYVDEDDGYDDDDAELDSPVSVCTPGVTPTPTAMSKHEPSEGVGGADDDDHDDDGDTQQLAERVSAARARQAELQERRCRLESELLAERPRRVASLLGRDLRVRTSTGTGTDNTSGDESKAAAGPGSVSVSVSGSGSGSGCGWQLCRDLREDVSLGRMPGGVLLAEAYCTAATPTTRTTSASASSASGTPGPSVVVVAAVDLLALRLDKGEAAAVARRAAFEGEAERLRAIPHHPRLCNFLQLCSGPRECALVFDGGDDAYDGGTQTAAAGSSTDTAMDIGRGMGMACSLQQFIRAHGPRLAPTLSRTLFTDLLTALAFLHERGLHHGQITADSVLIYPRRRGDSGTGAPARSDGQQPTGTVVASSSSSSSSSSAATLSLGHTDSFSELCLEVGWVNTGDGIMEEAMPMPMHSAAVSMTPLAHALLTPRLRADPQAILSPPVLAAEGDGEAGAEVGGGGGATAVSDDDDEVSLRPLPAGGEFSCRLLPAVGSMMHPAADHITAAASGSVADDLWSLGALLHLMLAGSAVLLLEPDPTTADALDEDDDDDDGGGGDDSGAKEAVEGGAAASRGARTGSRADVEPELDPSLPEASADMVRQLVRTDPAKRQSAASSLEHRWIVEASQLPRASSRSNFEEELRALNRDRKEARQARIERAKALKQAPPPGSAGRAGRVQHDQAQQQMQAQEAHIGADVDAALNPFYSSDDDQSTGSSSSSWSDGEDERAPRHVAAAAGGAGAAATEWTEI